MRRAVILTITLVGMLAAEPSVYGGSSSGVSGSQVQRNKTAIYKLRQETARLREEIEGLRSIIEGLNQTVGRLQQRKGSGGGNTKLLTDMSNLLDKINQNYVSKAELKRALKGHKLSTKPKPSIVASSPKPKGKTTAKATPTSSSKSSKTDKLAKASSSALYSKGVRLMRKKRYTEAKKRFEILAKRGYKKASTHFYLGEIAYHTSHYSDAVEEYKRSAELNESASYMDRLLLHTGIALEKSGDRRQAKRFFQAIIDTYPNTTSAKVAKKHL